MKFLSRISFIFFIPVVFSTALLSGVDSQVVENQYDYLADGDVAGKAERFFNVNTDEIGPLVFMVAQGFFWTINDLQNALLSLEVMSDGRQINKVLTDLKKFIALGPEKHLEESLLKNTIASTLKGLVNMAMRLQTLLIGVCVQMVLPSHSLMKILFLGLRNLKILFWCLPKVKLF